MKPVTTKSTADTRQRVLNSAIKVFAEKGFRDATVADICDRAGANVASVNYYFRDKESLYDEVWRGASAVAAGTFPLDTGISPDSTPEERLEVFVTAMLSRVLTQGPEAQFSTIMVRELADPTSALPHIVDEVVRPTAEHVMGILRELLGPDCPDEQVHCCMLSVVSQCLFLSFNRPIRARLLGGQDFSEKHIPILARHVAQFSLAGIRALASPEDSL